MELLVPGTRIGSQSLDLMLDHLRGVHPMIVDVAPDSQAGTILMYFDVETPILPT